MSSTSGNITLTGYGGSSPAGNNGGVVFENALSTSGNISITGTGGTGSAGFNGGIYASGNVTTTGSGTITIKGYAGGSASDTDGSFGVYVIDSAISAAGGLITVQGTGGVSSTFQYNPNAGVWIQACGSGCATSITNTGNGGITIVGTGATGGSTVDGYGVNIDGGSSISTANGAISITGTGATGSGGTNHGIYFSDVSSVGDNNSVSTTGGTITLVGIVGGGAGSYGIINDAATNAGAQSIIGGASTGNITLQADSLNLGSGTSIQSAGSVTLYPYTSGTAVSIGSGTSGSGMYLSDTELGYLSWGTLLTLGDGTYSGNMDINTANTFAGATAFTVAAGKTITLDSGVTASGAVTFNNPVIVDANATINTSSGNAAVDFAGTVSDSTSDTHALTVNAGTGLVTFGGAVGGTELASLSVTGPTTLDGSVTTGGGQTYNSAVTLGGNDTLTTASGSVSFGGAVSGGSHSLTVDSAGSITLSNGATMSSTAAGNAIVLAAGGNFVNDSGSDSPLTTSNGNWIVYSTQASADTNGASVMNPAQTINGQTYVTDPPSSFSGKNTWVYSTAGGPTNEGTVDITATGWSETYGNAIPTLTYSCSGNATVCGSVATYLTGVLAVSNESSTAELAAALLTHANGFDVTGATGMSSGNGTYTIIQNALTWANSYTGTIDYTSANLTLSAKHLTDTGFAVASRAWDGTTAATITSNGSLTGGGSTSGDGEYITGDAVSIASGGTATFGVKNVGTETATGSLSLTGAEAGDYSLTAPTANATIGIPAINVSHIVDPVWREPQSATADNAPLPGIAPDSSAETASAPIPSLNNVLQPVQQSQRASALTSFGPGTLLIYCPTEATCFRM